MKEILQGLMQFQNQIRILHWQTNSYARHKAYDFAYTTLNDLLDDFIEVYQGKYNRIKFETNTNIELSDLDEINLNEFLSKFIGFLTETLPSKLDEKDTDLLNIRDEILGVVHKLKYLLTLK